MIINFAAIEPIELFGYEAMLCYIQNCLALLKAFIKAVRALQPLAEATFSLVSCGFPAEWHSSVGIVTRGTANSKQMSSTPALSTTIPLSPSVKVPIGTGIAEGPVCRAVGT